LIFAPRGKLSRALTFTFTNAKVTQVEVIGDPARLRELDIAVLTAESGASMSNTQALERHL
jgi:hypothetical protein